MRQKVKEERKTPAVDAASKDRHLARSPFQCMVLVSSNADVYWASYQAMQCSMVVSACSAGQLSRRRGGRAWPKLLRGKDQKKEKTIPAPPPPATPQMATYHCPRGRGQPGTRFQRTSPPSCSLARSRHPPPSSEQAHSTPFKGPSVAVDSRAQVEMPSAASHYRPRTGVTSSMLLGREYVPGCRTGRGRSSPVGPES